MGIGRSGLVVVGNPQIERMGRHELVEFAVGGDEAEVQSFSQREVQAIVEGAAILVRERTSGEEQIVVAGRGNVQLKKFVRRLNGHGLRG